MDAQARLRELIQLQLGNQVLLLCEQQAQHEAQAAEIIKLKAALEKLTPVEP